MGFFIWTNDIQVESTVLKKSLQPDMPQAGRCRIQSPESTQEVLVTEDIARAEDDTSATSDMENTSSSFLNTDFGTQHDHNGCRIECVHRAIRGALLFSIYKKPPHASRINICVFMIFSPLQPTSCNLYQSLSTWWKSYKDHSRNWNLTFLFSSFKNIAQPSLIPLQEIPLKTSFSE